MSSRRGPGLHWVDATAGADVGEGAVGSYAAVLTCDVSGLGADLTTVDLLSRLSLTARRGGSRLQLRRVNPELASLLHLVGLDEILMGVPSAPLDRGGQPEQREELGVEEGGDLGDPAV
jgi:STAS domain-containing protein